MQIKRMWINQPSILQPLYSLHGTLVLAYKEDAEFYRVYFLEGPVLSQRMHQSYLSDGWPDHLANRRKEHAETV